MHRAPRLVALVLIAGAIGCAGSNARPGALSASGLSARDRACAGPRLHAKDGDSIEEAARARSDVEANGGPAALDGAWLPTNDPPDGARIESIGVAGARTVPARLVRDVMTMRAGDAFDADAADADVRRILALGAFEDVRLVYERKSGVALTIQVAERPLLRNVFFADGSSAPENGEWVVPRARDLYDPAAIERSLAVLVRDEIAEGYLDALADGRAARVDRDHVDLCLRVESGEQWLVSGFDFPGASRVAANELTAEMHTESGKFNAPGKPYRESEMETDAIRIAALYYDRGMLKVKVAKPLVTRDAATHGLRVAIPIEEGPVFRIEHVTFEGRLAGARKGYADAARVKIGAVFSRAEIAEATARVREHHRKLVKKASTSVDPDVTLHEERGTVDLVYRVVAS